MLPNSSIFKRLSSQEDLVSYFFWYFNLLVKSNECLCYYQNNDEVTVEEKNKDSIYNVTYRKVYNQNSSQPQNLNGLVYSKIKIKQIKFGTIEKLVDCFTNDIGELDSNTTNTFLATYRTFTTIKNVLEVLFKK